MKTRYFVSDSYKLDDNVVGRELYLKHGAYYFKDGMVSNCVTFCGENQEYEIHITKVEEMELSDFIADGRTKYELNGIWFVVNNVSNANGFIEIKTDKHCSQSDILNSNGESRGRVWAIFSRNTESARHYGSHTEDIKLVTTCEQCGKGEVKDLGLCSDCIIVYTSSQYIEAIEKEVPELSDVRNKYDVQIVGKDGVKTTVDVYRVLNAFDVHDAATQHAIKKLLAAGNRGHKDYVQDLKEAIASVELAVIEWEQENEY